MPVRKTVHMRVEIPQSLVYRPITDIECALRDMGNTLRPLDKPKSFLTHPDRRDPRMLVDKIGFTVIGISCQQFFYTLYFPYTCIDALHRQTFFVRDGADLKTIPHQLHLLPEDDSFVHRSV